METSLDAPVIDYKPVFNVPLLRLQADREGTHGRLQVAYNPALISFFVCESNAKTGGVCLIDWLKSIYMY